VCGDEGGDGVDEGGMWCVGGGEGDVFVCE
jgi:hypothetical protein